MTARHASSPDAPRATIRGMSFRVLGITLATTSLLFAQEPPRPGATTTTSPAAYDPLRVDDTKLAAASLLDVVDPTRQRTIPIRVQLPTTKEPAPVVLCSHGLGGTRFTCDCLSDHWAKRGYVAVFLQHPGSDDSVWRDVGLGKRMAAMRDAASGKNLLLRTGDVRAVLDQLATWNADADHPLHGRLDLEHVGMSGHSFGAMTTQAVSGQSMPVIDKKLVDERIDAAFAMSPGAPADPDRAFGKVKVPWLLMTGTNDVSAIRETDVATRRKVFPALPKTIDRYELVLDGAEHSAFTERGLPGDGHQRNPNHHRVILAISTAFWDTQLRGDTAARAWLDGDGPRSVLEPKDLWQHARAESASVR